MSLLKEWRDHAYSFDMQKQEGQLFWANYFNMEKEVYIKLLSDPSNIWEGTVEDLAKKAEMELSYFVGFLDGIDESLVKSNDVENVEKESRVSLEFDKEKLYYNMVGAKADWLYELAEWDELLPEDRKRELYLEQRKSGTVVNEKKVGRNEPCPCGSGKKYKQCCINA